MSATLVCPLCDARWKIVPEGDGDTGVVCPVCVEKTEALVAWANSVDAHLPRT